MRSMRSMFCGIVRSMIENLSKVVMGCEDVYRFGI
jgi:hypothetical protein